ncbi:hypothetical protein SDC9_157151 [bioreactor metagenome]|uniref:Uncharacterized protein n=1 Tax=bioreactor metagenome TaxID=1076179 RepID=A0A645F663_9ZZZZ
MFFTKLFQSVNVYLVAKVKVKVIYLCTVSQEVQETDCIMVKYSNVPGYLVSKVYFMTMLGKPGKCASHGDYVIVRVGGEDDYPFREWCCSFGSC